MELRGQLRGLRDVLIRHRHSGIAREGRLAGEQLVQQASGRVQVRAGVDHLAPGLLGGQVLGRADHRVRLRHRRSRIRDGAGDSEVHHLDLAVRRDHDVAGFDVPMDDAFVVRVLQRGEHPDDDLDGVVERHGLTVAQQRRDGAPPHVLHDDVRQGDLLARRGVHGFFAGVVDGDDRRMVQRCGRLGFTTEASEEHRVCSQIRSQYLDGDRARQPGVVTQVDLRHTATADEIAYLVAVAQDTGNVAHVCHLSLVSNVSYCVLMTLPTWLSLPPGQ